MSCPPTTYSSSIATLVHGDKHRVQGLTNFPDGELGVDSGDAHVSSEFRGHRACNKGGVHLTMPISLAAALGALTAISPRFDHISFYMI